MTPSRKKRKIPAIISRVIRLFSPPKFVDLEKNRKARLLNGLLLLVASVSFATAIIYLFVSPRESWVAMIGAFAIGSCYMAVRFLMQRGKVQLPSFIFVATFWGLLTGSLFYRGGVMNPGFGGYILVVLMSGLLLELRYSILVGVLSVIAAIFLGATYHFGRMPVFLLDNDVAIIVTKIIILIVAVALLHLTVGSISHALIDAHVVEEHLISKVHEMKKLVGRLNREVEERKEAEAAAKAAKEQAENASRAKSNLVSVVSHELKSPLSTIYGYTDILTVSEINPLTEEQLSYLNIVKDNVQRMTKIIGDLSDVSHIEAGQISLEFEPIRLHWLVQTVVRSLDQEIQHGEQTVHLHVPEKLPDVWGDNLRLVQILTNLLSNASKYTLQGGEIVIHAYLTTDNRFIEVAVSDTGIGIKETDQPKIFQQFYRVKDKQTRRITGTGLGLSITKMLVELHGGKIWFESEYGRGTTFFFTIPTAISQQHSANP